MLFWIETLGCKVNAYESEMMREKLIQSGYQLSEEYPDIVIVNTCAVTNVANHKSFEMVKRYRKKYPEAILVVCGCSSEEKNDLYTPLGIDILLGNQGKSHIVDAIQTFQKNHEKIISFAHTRNLPFENMEVSHFEKHTRAFVKVQDGCNHFCSYCVIPYVRGIPRCKEYDAVLKEVETLVSHGHQEVVLTGIHTGSYLDSKGHDLTDLIHGMSEIEGLKRIRISSIEVNELNEKFLKELSQNQKICDHFHIPLQAGSDEILKKMNRRYDLDFFAKKVKEIRKIRPDVSITTDIIVGHPYETDELFQETIQFAKKIAFSKIHVFPYSKKEGTASSFMDHQVSEEEKKNRSHELCQLSNEFESLFAERFIGQILEVLIEKSGEVSSGLTSNYLRVCVEENIPNNTFVKVFIQKKQGKILYGSVVKENILQ